MSDSTKCLPSLNAPPTPNIVATLENGSSITLGVGMTNTRKEAPSSTANSDGHSPQQSYSRQIGHYRGSTSRVQQGVVDLDDLMDVRGVGSSSQVGRADRVKQHLARGRMDRLVRSVSVLDEWLDQNEGHTEDEARVGRMKGLREEALEQLGLLLNPDRA